MLKNYTPEEQDKLIQELITADFDSDRNSLFQSNKSKSRKSLKTPIEKVRSYKLIVEASVFWASRQVYLELVQSFLLKKIDGEILTSKFFKLRIQDMIRKDELCAIIEDQIHPIPDLYYTSKAEDFNSAIGDLYLEIDRYDPNVDGWDVNCIVYSERQLRSVIQQTFVPRFQQSCDLHDSFFRLEVDFD